jgi:hypothetical protein
VILGSTSPLIEDCIKTIRQGLSNVPTTIKLIKELNTTTLRFDQSAIIFGKQELIRKFRMQARLTNKFPKELKILIHTTNLSMFSGTKFLVDNAGKKRTIELNEYFLHETSKIIDFVTFEWFTASACNKRQKRVINSYDKRTKSWKKIFRLNNNKFREFHGCKLVAMQKDNSYRDKFENPKGQAFDVLDVIGSASNFSIYRQLGSVASRNIKLTMQKNLKLKPQILTSFRIIISRQFHLTAAFENIHFTIFTTLGEPYGGYEKLLMPFDKTTWCLLILIFAFAFAAIFTITLLSKRLQRLIYGEEVKTPAFNVVAIFFGVSQLQLPESNFPRIILMHFILFCLVIRTAHQGVFFELMASDMRKPVPTTIEELVYQNYNFYGSPNSTSARLFNTTVNQE